MRQLLIVSHHQDSEAAAALAQRVISHADHAENINIRTVTADALLETERLPQADAAWVYAGNRLTRGLVIAVLDLLTESGAPALLSTHEELAPGAIWCESAVVAPPDDHLHELHLMLQALLYGGQAGHEIRAELDLLRRQHSGITGQINRLDEELRLASRLQRQFLPATLPKLGGVSYDVLFRPAGYVSGDIYDVQVLDRHHSVFYVADAVGHGVPAALLTMFIKQSLQPRDVHGIEPRILTPDEALGRLNHDMCLRQHGPTQFATACYGLLDARSGELLLARAGHPPPILVRADGDVQLLQPDGALLGVFEEETYQLQRVKVRPGDRLLVYSDGFEFAFGNAEAHAIEDYSQELRRLCSGPLDRVVARLEERLDQQAGSLHQQDDLTVLLVDVVPQPEEAEPEPNDQPAASHNVATAARGA